MNKVIPIIIPAYEPDERLITLVHSLADGGEQIIIVDDGSGVEYEPIFKECEGILGNNCVLLKHEINRGKGRALKTAFSYVLARYPEAIGVVTADSDGQHTRTCIKSVKEALLEHMESLILGVRSFDGAGIPWKSMFGNKLTIKMLSYVSGIKVSDTQTGLRGIPRTFMRELLSIEGERFEFETRMLIESAKKYPIMEVPIETIYDSESNHQTHFNPITDSIKIYSIFGKMFLKYVFSSFTASFVDLVCFVVFCHFLRTYDEIYYVTIATVLARLISASYNFYINYKVVFHSAENIGKSVFKYCLLAVAQMSISAFTVTLGVYVLTFIPEVIIKIAIDTLLFFISYRMQQKYVF